MLISQLSSRHFLPFLNTKNFFMAQPAPQTINRVTSSNAAAAKTDRKASRQSTDLSVACKCCGWKGKDSEAKSEVFYVESVTELELFCPQCSSYLGFI